MFDINSATAIAGTLGALALGTISPGPNFVMVARTAVTRSRTDGIAAAAGIGIGAVCFAWAALLGLQALFTAVPLVYVVFRIVGGTYLLYLAWRIWRAAGKSLFPENTAQQLQVRQVFRSGWTGLLTQLSNPITAIMHAGIFASLWPANMPLRASVGLTAGIFILEISWYSFVSIVLSSASPRRTYFKARTGIDRVAGGVMALLGLRLLLHVILPS